MLCLCLCVCVKKRRERATNEDNSAVVGEHKRGVGHGSKGGCSLIGKAEGDEIEHSVPGCAHVSWFILLFLLLGAHIQETLLEEREEQAPPHMDGKQSERVCCVTLCT